MPRLLIRSKKVAFFIHISYLNIYKEVHGHGRSESKAYVYVNAKK